MQWNLCEQIKLMRWVEFDLSQRSSWGTLTFPKCFKTFSPALENRRGIFPTFIKLIAMMFHLKWIYLFIFFSFIRFVLSKLLNRSEGRRAEWRRGTLPSSCKMNAESFRFDRPWREVVHRPSKIAATTAIAALHSLVSQMILMHNGIKLLDFTWELLLVRFNLCVYGNTHFSNEIHCSNNKFNFQTISFSWSENLSNVIVSTVAEVRQANLAPVHIVIIHSPILECSISIKVTRGAKLYRYLGDEFGNRDHDVNAESMPNVSQAFGSKLMWNVPLQHFQVLNFWSFRYRQKTIAVYSAY